MKNLIKLEIQRCLRRKQFTFVLLVLFLSIACDFIFLYTRMKGIYLSDVMSAQKGMILTSIIKSPFYPVFTLLLPLTISLVYSDSYLENDLNGTNNFINTRISRYDSIMAKAVTIAVVSFFMIFIPLILSQILALIAFPIQGYNNFGLPDYKSLSFVPKGMILSGLQNYYPYTNNLIFILIRSMLAVSFALLSYGISFIPKVNKFITVLFPFILHVLVTIALTTLGFMLVRINPRLAEILMTNVFYTNAYGSLYMLLGILTMYMSLGILLIKRGIKHDI